MTALEKAVADALRLSDAATEKMLPTIQRNIEVAKAELIRSGCLKSKIDELGALVEDAIITFCLMKMDEESQSEKRRSEFISQQDNLRKSLYEE